MSMQARKKPNPNGRRKAPPVTLAEVPAAWAEVYGGKVVSVRPDPNRHHTVPLYRAKEGGEE